MKRIFSLLLALLCFAMLALPVYATDNDGDSEGGGTVVTTPEPPTASDAYIVSFTATTVSSGTITSIKPGDKFNLVIQVVDHAAYQYYGGATEKINDSSVSAQLNNSTFSCSSAAEIGKVETELGSFRYNLLFRNVTYNGGGNSFDFNLSYPKTALEFKPLSVTIGQCINPSEVEANSTTPNLIVRNASYGSSIITAGTPFTLTVDLYASGGDTALEDVIARVQLPQGVSLTGGSTSIYVGKMSPNSTQMVSFSILPSASFTGEGGNGMANIVVDAESGGSVANSITVSVPIEQPDRFELGNLELYDNLIVGQSGSVTLNFVNKGQNTVANLEATISGTNFTADDTYLYLGNLAPGMEGSVDFDIYPESAGPVSGVITLQYEYADGTTKTVTKDFTASAEEPWYPSFDEPGMWEDPGFVEPDQPSGLPVWGIALIAALVVLVIIIVVVVVRKRRKAKALAELEDGEDEDF